VKRKGHFSLSGAYFAQRPGFSAEKPGCQVERGAAVNAYSSAIMAISGFDAVIPLDQVIQTVSDVGITMPSCVKCTGKGGLAITKATSDIAGRLK